MAKEAGVHATQVSRIWRAHGLKPHRVKTFKLSRAPRFVEKLRDVVGLYLAPPERAIVFSFDEKCQIQALDLQFILDNYATHKHRKVKAWLEKHLRVHVHFRPTSASWMNLVERFFSELTQRQLKRLAFSSVPELEGAIHRYTEACNRAGGVANREGVRPEETREGAEEELTGDEAPVPPRTGGRTFLVKYFGTFTLRRLDAGRSTSASDPASLASAQASPGRTAREIQRFHLCS
jgi:hypothetical protein